MVNVFCATKCMLGEGPVWSDCDNSLYWVDILGKKLFCKGIFTELQQWDLPMMFSAISIVDKDALLMVSENGIYSFSCSDGALTLLSDVESEDDSTRSNDGAADASGRFWFGTMDMKAERDSGRVYSYRVDEGLRTIKTEFGIPNTFVWSPKNDKMYLADSKCSEIYVHDFCIETGTLTNQELFVRVSRKGAPDGSAIDVEGFLWNAQWDHSQVVRYSPRGDVDRVVKLPVTRPTSCTFGGKDNKTLFITSARDGLSEAELASSPLSGAVFMIQTDVAGVVNHQAKKMKG